MSQQNINQYNYKKWFITNHKSIFDISLASDERDYNEEVVFSTKLIGENDGNRLPIHFDLNNSGSSRMFSLNYGDYNTGNTLVSLNYYNPNNDDLSCYTSTTLCDIGLTGIDNGLTTEISGETLFYTMGLYTGDTKWDRYHYDRRLKLIPVSYSTNEPLELVLTSQLSSGSVIVDYLFSAKTQINFNVSIGFTQLIGRTNGNPIVISTGITIFSGFSTGMTTVVIDESFSNLNRTSTFTDVSISGIKYTLPVVITENVVFETPPPSPTPTTTPICDQFITDELGNGLMTENSDNIISEYNNCQTPTPTPTPTITPTRTLTPTPSITSTRTPTPSITPTLTPTQSITPTRTLTPTPSPTPSSTLICYSELESLDVGDRTGSIIYNTIDNTIYVASVENPYVFVINPTTFTVLNTITLSKISSYFESMSYYSGTNSVYGSYIYTDNSIGIISANTEYSTVSVVGPRGLTTQNNQQRVYIGGTSQIRVLDTNTNTISSIGSLGSGSFHSTYNDVDNTMYFSLYVTNQVKVYDFSTSTITATIDVGIQPTNMSFNPVLNRIYVLNETDDTVSVVNCNTNTVIATITGMTNVLSILYIPNTTKLLVSNLNGIVYKINCSNNTITCSQDLGTNIPDMVYNPNDGLVYASNYSETNVRRFIP